MDKDVSDTNHEHTGHGHDDVSSEVEPAEATLVPHGHDNSDGHHDKKDPVMFSGQETEAGKLVIEFHNALENGNATRVRELLDDNILIFEGGGVERSADQYTSHHMISDMAFLKSIDIKILEQQVKVHGNSAVAMSRSKMSGNYKEKEIDIDSMETMVLNKKNGQWKITHLHWSNK
ncbi:MAG: nuclear transport factor 2 family protein [Gammaproteobacteria bacterium]|nr:nuclear transport factor 2 family protein [Gammaproteobacteria bacterium]MBT8141783.1 nuclear transport factor 2 family protein [Gammaproteobacteria bacterium]